MTTSDIFQDKILMMGELNEGMILLKYMVSLH